MQLFGVHQFQRLFVTFARHCFSFAVRAGRPTLPRLLFGIKSKIKIKIKRNSRSGDSHLNRNLNLHLNLFPRQPTTSMPMLRAVPATTRKAASSFTAFKSFIFNFTMSITCFFVTLPTFSLFGVLDPEAMPAAFFSSADAGGDLVMNVNDLSW